jgi:site-specific DNA-cytosine methylase
MATLIPKQSANEAESLVTRLTAAVAERGLSFQEAAVQIGVGVNTLERHLSGAHVRSDSLRKYENWLAGKLVRKSVFRQPKQDTTLFPAEIVLEEPLPAPPGQPHLVVDIFSGCGGLSLGFDLLNGGGHFRTVLALDIQAAPVAVFNSNSVRPERSSVGIARLVDLTEFLDETEVLAFYVDHVIRLHGDRQTRKRMDALAGGSFPRFLAELQAIDAAFLDALASARADKVFRAAYARTDNDVFSQTSVVGFHEALKLPKAVSGRPSLSKVIWSDGTSERPPKVTTKKRIATPELLLEAQLAWEEQVAALESKQQANGRGQLQASAPRIRKFVTLVRSPAFTKIREAWCTWQAQRLGLRSAVFQDEAFALGIRALYQETYPVSVLLGGPPCQGFSRIGRGKIRSLREAHVHVHGDEAVGDIRNLLYQRYLLVLSALRPLIFKFENVEHFKSTVKTDGREFLATEILAEAIAEVSGGNVSFAVSSRTVDASAHGIPQTRQRFFMSGVRRDAFPGQNAEALAARCLSLPTLASVTVNDALEGLPEASLGGGDQRGTSAMASMVTVAETAPGNPTSPASHYTAWVRQPRPGHNRSPAETDSHVARASREDDTELFARFGPGQRWMDYRVDKADTLHLIRDILEAVAELPAAQIDRLSKSLGPKGQNIAAADLLKSVLSRVDGSLALRLVMEQIGTEIDAPHHLVTPTYLSKKDGNHGDWMARLDGNRPSKTITAHMGKDSYSYIHPQLPRTLSVREAARIQTFPDWFQFSNVALTDAFRMLGNAVPPMLSYRIAGRVAAVLASRDAVSVKALNQAA